MSLAYASGWYGRWYDREIVIGKRPDLRMLADCVQAAVDEDADVAFVALDNAADLGIAESFCPQVDGFALTGWQTLDKQAQARVQVGLFGAIRGVGLAAL